MDTETPDILRILRNLWTVSPNGPLSSMLYSQQKRHT